ncbi:MAG: DUF6690 family protein [Planctomycetota bacterium]
MFPRALAMPVLVAASVGVPYVANNPPEWLENGVSGVTSPANSSPAAPGKSVEALSTPPEARLFPSSTPLAGHAALSLEQALNLDVSKEWVYHHWPRKSTGLAEIDWYGVRVPLVTGTRLDDVAGSLTYYFGADNRVHRITLRGRTADTSRLVALATRRFGMARQPTPLPAQQLFQLRSGELVVSELRTKPASVLWDSLPHESFSFVMHLQRPETARPLPPDAVPQLPANPPQTAHSPQATQQPPQQAAAAQAAPPEEAPEAEVAQPPLKPENAWKSPRTLVPQPRVEDLDKLHRYR